MKFTVMLLCALVLTVNTGCIKALLDKDEENEPEQTNKYAGVWKLTAGAADQDGDLVLDNAERTGINGDSELALKTDFTYTYFLNVAGSNPLNMSGNWKMSTDNKSLSISDASGAIRFDIQSDNELHTEPITDRGSTVWLIYTR